MVGIKPCFFFELNFIRQCCGIFFDTRNFCVNCEKDKQNKLKNKVKKKLHKKYIFLSFYYPIPYTDAGTETHSSFPNRKLFIITKDRKKNKKRRKKNHLALETNKKWK